MEIIINTYNRINVYKDHYALCKKKKGEWGEYKWFGSLKHCMTYLVQERLSSEETALKLADYLKEYKRITEEFKKLIKV